MARVSSCPPFHALLMIAMMTLLLAVSFYYAYTPPELLPCTISVAPSGPMRPPMERRRMETLQRVDLLQEAKRSAVRERDILQNSGTWGEGHPEKKASREQRARKGEEEIEWMTIELAGLTTELARLEHEVQLAQRSTVVYNNFGRGGAWALWFAREIFPPLKHFTCTIVFHEEW